MYIKNKIGSKNEFDHMQYFAKNISPAVCIYCDVIVKEYFFLFMFHCGATVEK